MVKITLNYYRNDFVITKSVYHLDGVLGPLQSKLFLFKASYTVCSFRYLMRKAQFVTHIYIAWNNYYHFNKNARFCTYIRQNVHKYFTNLKNPAVLILTSGIVHSVYRCINSHSVPVVQKNVQWCSMYNSDQYFYWSQSNNILHCLDNCLDSLVTIFAHSLNPKIRRHMWNL